MREGSREMREQKDENLEWVKRFNAHLDSCYRCRTQCFNLCLVGAEILTHPPEDIDPFYAMKQEATNDRK